MHGDQPSLAPKLAMKMIQQQRLARAQPRPAPSGSAEEEASSEQREKPSATCARVRSSRCRNHMQSSEHGELERGHPSSRCSICKRSSGHRDQATATTGRDGGRGKGFQRPNVLTIRKKWRSSWKGENLCRPVPAAFKLLRG
ncbi:hypothetical protein ACOSP7_004446 [Xanthoceras sorbifolium]